MHVAISSPVEVVLIKFCGVMSFWKKVSHIELNN